MLKQRIILFAKWAWILLIIVGVSWYFSRNFDDVRQEIQRLSIVRLLTSLLLLIVGRLLIVELARTAVLATGSTQSYREMFRMVTLSELGKYLPGGIWHFVGRAGYYRTIGMTVTQAAKAIFTEHLWLAVSSALGGSILLVLYADDTYSIIGVLALSVLWILFSIVTLRETALTPTIRVLSRLIVLQSMIWLSLGLSYAVLLPLSLDDGIWLTIGAFAVSWLVGFVAVMAPGGIGVREVAITTLMLPLFPSQTTLILASVHRLLWVGVEILLGLIALLRRPTAIDQQ